MISYFAKEGKIRKKCNPYRKNSTMAEVGYFHKTKTYRNEVYFLFKYKHILNIDEFFKYCYSSKSSTRMIKIYLDKISCDANEYDYIPNEDANKYKLFKKITLEKQEDKSKMKKSLNKILN